MRRTSDEASKVTVDETVVTSAAETEDGTLLEGIDVSTTEVVDETTDTEETALILEIDGMTATEETDMTMALEGRDSHASLSPTAETMTVIEAETRVAITIAEGRTETTLATATALRVPRATTKAVTSFDTSRMQLSWKT